jgi:TfoX/Sxy family transcriptional regulator of competence genes
MPKPVLTIPAARLTEYDALVATQPDVDRKGATMPYTSVNGNMFSFLSPDGTLALRLPSEKRTAFLEKYASKLFIAHGATMSEYVVVPEPLWRKPKELAKQFAASYAYAQTLKPKKKTKR